MKTMSGQSIAKKVIQDEISALMRMREHLDSNFDKAVDTILASSGRVVAFGVGKSGIIAKKIVATLASTGTHALFIHPCDALHGDLGMVGKDDVAIMISNSGETAEILRVLVSLRAQNTTIIAITSRLHSSLARSADVILNIAVETEACHLNLAPTSSTTATLVMGDALAITLSSVREFNRTDFARLHPGGSLGARINLRVKDVMRTDCLPMCAPSATFSEVVHLTNKGRLGLTLVHRAGEILGIITDGDIRRRLETDGNIIQRTASEIMSENPKKIVPSAELVEAEKMLHEQKISALVVVEENHKIVGILDTHDIYVGQIRSETC